MRVFQPLAEGRRRQVSLTHGRGRILCATGYSLISEPGQPINDVPEISPEKTNVSFIPTDGTAELKLLVNGEPEKVDEVRNLC